MDRLKDFLAGCVVAAVVAAVVAFLACFCGRCGYVLAGKLFCHCGMGLPVIGAPVIGEPLTGGPVLLPTPLPGTTIEYRVRPVQSPTPAEHAPMPGGTSSGEETHSVLKGQINVPLVPLTEPEEIPPPRKPNQPPPCK